MRNQVTVDVARVRRGYPALADGAAYLDGAAGTQVPATVIDAIAGAYRAGLGNLGGAFAASHRSGEVVAECRRALADLVGGVPEGVVLGPNMTTLTYRLAGALADRWRPGDEVVVSRLDHDANVRPWVQAAPRVGAKIRWAEVDRETGELPAEQYADLVGDRTRLVAVTAASNVLGTRPDVPAIAATAHDAGALVFVDGVHATPHGPIDLGELGADFFTTSAYKWSGPHVGTIVADPGLLAGLHPDKLAPAPDEVPFRYERGTAPFADLAGVIAAVEHLAGLAPGKAETRRERVRASMAAVEDYEGRLLAELLTGLESLPGVTVYGRPARRAPTVFFNLAGRKPRDVAEHLAARGVNVWDGDNYAYELVGALGLRATGGAVRAGVVHYNDGTDVARLLEAVGELARGSV